MRVVIAPDSFKGSLSAVAAAQAMAEGARRAAPSASIREIPMADGGEGSVEALVRATDGTTARLTATGPLGDPVEAEYGVLGDGVTAVVETAAASGYSHLPAGRRDPRKATTYGTGDLIRHALDQGLRRFIIGLGGSATNDGGAGMAAALGYRFIGPGGAELPLGGAALARLQRIGVEDRHPALADSVFRVACDVDNPLCGPEGASAVYGPQKGADAEAVRELDAALRRLGEVIGEQFGLDVLSLPGAGAAGGMGAGTAAFLGGALEPGFEVVAEACGLKDALADADLVMTGEGALDHQTLRGKTPYGVARHAGRHGVPVVALAGCLGEDHEALYEAGVTGLFAIVPGPCALDEALAHGGANLARTAEAVVRLFMHAPGALKRTKETL